MPLICVAHGRMQTLRFRGRSEKEVSSAFVTGEKLTEFFRVCERL
jgi:hypothetical protein